MSVKQSFLTLVILFVATYALYAQAPDTLRRKDAAGWEFVQVKKGNIVLSEGYCLHEKNNGTWTYYWENGYPQHIYNYLDGKRDGMHIQISRQGFTELIENYKNDLLEGPRRAYQPGSSFLAEEVYYSEGRMHGRFDKRYPGGKPQEQASYNMDIRDGKTIWYYDNGEKAAEYDYRNGEIEGEVAAYHKNGKVSEFGLYKNNKQTGSWKEFHENGNLRAEGKYSDGLKDGPWKEYNEQGLLIKTVKYHKGGRK